MGNSQKVKITMLTLKARVANIGQDLPEFSGYMPMGQYILALNQGSIESKATLVDNKGKIIAQTVSPLKPFILKSGWVEYRPEDILKSQINVIRALFKKIGHKKRQISAIGLANQPSTIILWDRSTGKPLYNAIGQQDPRGIDICRERSEHRENVRERTGMTLSHYYSASKIKWILDNVKSARKLSEKGQLMCGTVNTYLIWHMTKGSVHATDHTNAAQTLLFNIFTKSWDKELLEVFSIPFDTLPSILPTSSYFGDGVIEGEVIPIHASIVENHASLIGNGCFQEGEVNVNYGREGFILMNTGKKIFILPGLLTTIAWSNNGNTTYLLEGTINAVGSLFEWMRDRLGLITNKDNLDDICRQSGERLFMLPAINGLGSPHWNTSTATCIFGLKPSSTKKDVIRSAVESIAFLVKDNFNLIEKDGRIQMRKVIASGDMSDISYLMQFQSDLLQMPVHKAVEGDLTARGVAFLSGLSTRMWQGLSSIERLISTRKAYSPKLDDMDAKKLYERWRLTCLYSKEWSKSLY